MYTVRGTVNMSRKDTLYRQKPLIMMVATMQTVWSGTLGQEKPLLLDRYLVGKAARNVKVVVDLDHGS